MHPDLYLDFAQQHQHALRRAAARERLARLARPVGLGAAFDPHVDEPFASRTLVARARRLAARLSPA